MRKFTRSSGDAYEPVRPVNNWSGDDQLEIISPPKKPVEGTLDLTIKPKNIPKDIAPREFKS